VESWGAVPSSSSQASPTSARSTNPQLTIDRLLPCTFHASCRFAAYGPCILDLTAAEESARGGFRRDRIAATRLAPTVTAAEQLGYATVAACWAAEHSAEDIFGPAEAMSYITVLQSLSDSLHTGTILAVAADLPPFAAPEVLALSDALARR